jgi:Ni/Co efflux regulator RcnB
MKTLALIAAAAFALPMAAMAQASSPTKPAADAKPAANTTGKKVVQKVVPKRVIKKVEEARPISEETDVTLSEQDLKVAETIHTGTIKCELGASVNIEADAKKPGFFTLTHAGVKYRLHPVNSRTGAVRLEDPVREAMWLQLGNKSMLMSQKQGLRLADECQAAKQVEVAEDMKKNPPKSLFEGDAPPATAKQ